MGPGNEQNPLGKKPTQSATLIPTLGAEEAREKKASSGKTTMAVGGIFVFLGIVLTLFSDFEVLWWGAIVFGAVAFFSGLAQVIKANRDN